MSALDEGHPPSVFLLFLKSRYHQLEPAICTDRKATENDAQPVFERLEEKALIGGFVAATHLVMKEER